MGKKLTDEQIEQRKEMRDLCDRIYANVSSFLTGHPPQSVVNGSANTAIEYKDAIQEARRFSPNAPTRIDYLEGRIVKLGATLAKLKKFV